VAPAEAYDLVGRDHERVADAQRPPSAPKTEAAPAALKVGEHEEVVRVGVIAAGVSDTWLV
jgi:hypothetical protein